MLKKSDKLCNEDMKNLQLFRLVLVYFCLNYERTLNKKGSLFHNGMSLIFFTDLHHAFKVHVVTTAHTYKHITKYTSRHKKMVKSRNCDSV